MRILIAILLIVNSLNIGERKAMKVLSKFYDEEVSIVLEKELSNGVLYSIRGKEDKVYIGKAPSKFESYIFIHILDKEVGIKFSKILIYREDYGGEIGSKRWLNQLIGLKPHQRVDNISAISGATISVNSMLRFTKEALIEIKNIRHE